MSRDNWERLVVAVVRREQIWQMFHSHSISPSISSISSSNSSATLSGQVLLDNGFEPFQISPSRTSSAPALTKTSNKKERLKGTADYGDENRAYLSKAVKKKLEDLSPNVRESVFMLRKLQTQHDNLESEFFRKREALEAKYQKLYQPLYSMRYKMINYNETRNQTDNDDDRVPDFWLTAMRNNVVLSREISKHDEEALKFIEDIQWSRVDYPKGFKLIFHFGPNPFFKNSKLTKTYCITDEIQPVLEKAIGTDIDWYREKNLTQKIKTKKPNKWSKIVNQLIAKTEQCESFFNFFSPPRVAEYEALDDVAEKIEKLMVKDYEMGLIIRDKIVPHAVSWFTEEATQ